MEGGRVGVWRGKVERGWGKVERVWRGEGREGLGEGREGGEVFRLGCGGGKGWDVEGGRR